jgi:iron complex outermembrane receptor protein
VAALAALAGAHSGDLQAQQAQDTIAIAPIEVSVLRTPFTNDDAPFAVSVLTEQDLQRARSGVYIEEALQRMPGVQVQNRYNPAVGERIMIRGFGARAQFGLRGFRVIVDGIPATLPDGQASLDHLDIGTLGRVEVLRGPSSALFGNAGGGVISFTTRAPAARPFEVEVAAVGGSDALMRGQVTASGTVEGTGYLVSAYRSSADGFREVPDSSAFLDDGSCTFGDRCTDSYGEFERLGANAKVTHAMAGGELALTVNVLDLQAENPGSRRLQDSIPFGTIANTYLSFVTRKDITQQQAGLRWVGPLGGFQGDLAVYGAHRTVYNPIPNDLVDLERNGGGLRAALSRLHGLGIGDLEWHAGFDLDIQDDDRKEFTNVAGEPVNPLLDQQENVRGMGLFLQGNLELVSGIDALAGLRYDSHKFEAEDRIPSPDNSGDRTMTAVSPSIGINIPLPGGLDIFGSASTLFETPTTTELANQPDQAGGFNPDLDPMDGVSFEAGLRGDLGSVAAFEVTAYQTTLQNELIPFEVEGSPGVTYFRNAGESKHQGLEATLSAGDPSGLVRADVSGTWTDARFEEYVVGGTDLGDCPTGDPEDTDGCRVPGVSPRRIQALLRVSPDFSFGEAFVEAIATLSDDVPVNDRNTAAAPDYEVIDLRAGLDQVAVGGLTLSPWVAITNVTDEEYISSVAVNAFGTRFYEPGPPQSFQVGLRAAFGVGD